jgi:hypothetical protein
VGNARGAKVPEVVMRIAVRQLRLQRRFLGQRQPVIASEWHDGTPVAGQVPRWADFDTELSRSV